MHLLLFDIAVQQPRREAGLGMPRIRTIKPEFWVDEKIVELDPWAQLLFIGLWNFADDQGYIDYSPRRIKMQIFPGNTEDVVPLLASLLDAGLLAAYEAPTGRVLHIVNWIKHQKVSNPALPRFDPSELDPFTLSPDPPREASVALASPLDSSALNGKERKGKEGKGIYGDSAADVDQPGLDGMPDEPPPLPEPGSDNDPHWCTFWQAYPKKESKKEARVRWAAAIKNGVDPTRIIAAAERYARQVQAEQRHSSKVKNPDGWLNTERFNDELPDRPPPANGSGNGGQFQPFRNIGADKIASSWA